jgi:hypothetical protein
MSKPTGGGLQLIKEAVAARRLVWSRLARDCHCSLDALDGFSQGRAELPLNIVHSVVGFLWQYVEYDPELDILRPIPQPPARSVGVLPRLEMKLPRYKYGPPENLGPQPEIAAPKRPKHRPGWL